VLQFADSGQAADLAAYLTRLLRYDKQAVVRAQAHENTLGVFSRPPFGVIALRAVRLAWPVRLDATVAAKALLAGLSHDDATFTVPPVALAAGAAWAGVLPPRTGWQPLAEVFVASLVEAVTVGMDRFRQRTEALTAAERTRARLDEFAEEVWSRPVVAGLPLRAAHAARVLGFLAGGEGGQAVVLASGAWLRLSAPYGSVSVRRHPEQRGLRLI